MVFYESYVANVQTNIHKPAYAFINGFFFFAKCEREREKSEQQSYYVQCDWGFFDNLTMIFFYKSSNINV